MVKVCWKMRERMHTNPPPEDHVQHTPNTRYHVSVLATKYLYNYSLRAIYLSGAGAPPFKAVPLPPHKRKICFVQKNYRQKMMKIKPLNFPAQSFPKLLGLSI